MQEKPSFNKLSDEQTIAWYQHHMQVLHSYALALALKAGLSPVEAARFFVEPWHANHHATSARPTAQLLEQQAKQVASVSALSHGEEQVHLEQQERGWLVEVTIVDREPLERYSVSLEVYTQWVGEQLRQVCELKGIRCAVWLDQDVQFIQLSLQADS